MGDALIEQQFDESLTASKFLHCHESISVCVG
jgi:hypothetical protein